MVNLMNDTVEMTDQGQELVEKMRKLLSPRSIPAIRDNMAKVLFELGVQLIKDNINQDKGETVHLRNTQNFDILKLVQSLLLLKYSYHVVERSIKEPVLKLHSNMLPTPEKITCVIYELDRPDGFGLMIYENGEYSLNS